MFDTFPIPIIQAPMLGATTEAIAVAVSEARLFCRRRLVAGATNQIDRRHPRRDRPALCGQYIHPAAGRP
jgi:NAD(P)H-dependent flavin oxidoreductase YrpB (nitropropane dioxygenase family)